MSTTGNIETLVSDYLNKVKKGNVTEELSYAENLPNTKSVAELLQRVTKTPQILQNLITTSLPYLLITPEKNKKKKQMRANSKVTDNESRRVKKRLHKKSVFTKTLNRLSAERSETKLTTESLTNSKLELNRKNETSKKKSVIKKRSKISTKRLKSNTNFSRNVCVNKDSITSMVKKKKKIIKKEQLISESLKKSLLDGSIDSQNKITNALKHSSLFSITEKSHLSLNNYAPVEIDTLLLQKLIALDKDVAKNVINNVLGIEDDLSAPDNSELSAATEVDDEQNEKVKKKIKKSSLKRTLVKELKLILLTRLKAQKERPAEILYNVILKLCKKNKIVDGLHFKKVQNKKKPTEPTRLQNKMTSKKLKQGSQKLRTLINQHQQLLEKMHS